jgi:hypothetical protein
MLGCMSLSRRLRRWICGGMAMAVLFTQLAIAAYSCPVPDAAAVSAHAAMTLAMPDCHGMSDSDDPVQPQLCKAHCSNDAQSAARALLPDLQPNPASVALLLRVIESIAPAPITQAQRPPPPLVRATTSLPLYLSLHVLRN